MQIDAKRYKRLGLPDQAVSFLKAVIPFARIVQQYTFEKARHLRIATPIGLSASIVTAEIIHKSKWGLHEVAAKGSNLMLLEADEFFRGKALTFEGRKYRTYDTWLDFCIDYSDEVTFQQRHIYERVLLARNVDEQLDRLAEIQIEPTSYHRTIEEMIEGYGLWEFDYFRL